MAVTEFDDDINRRRVASSMLARALRRGASSSNTCLRLSERSVRWISTSSDDETRTNAWNPDSQKSVSPPPTPHARRWSVSVHDDGGVGLGVAMDYDDRGDAFDRGRNRRNSTLGASARDEYEEYVESLTPRQASVVHAPGVLDKATGRYRIEVTTGTNRGAGTNGRVELTLVGADGLTYPVALQYDKGIDPQFSRASCLPFRFAVSARLGELRRTRVRLVPELTAVGRGWYLDDIRVTCENTGDEWVFPCHRWFGQSDSGDGQSGPYTQDLDAKSADELRRAFGAEGEMPRKERGEFECVASGAAVPHPEKTKRDGARAVVRRTHGHGGEDAYFIARAPGHNNVGMGIADGVYLWRWQGIDAGEYSRALMTHAAEALISGAIVRPTAMMAHAYDEVNNAGMKGSTTACIVVIDKEHGLMYCSNVGDSGFMLIRGEPGGRYVAHRSPPQEHNFGCPFQLGHHETSDKASDAMRTKLYLEPGDIVVLGSDGLWDNLSEVEVLASVEASVADEAKVDQKAIDIATRNLLARAYDVSMDRSRVTPYSLAATEHFDMVYSGGKKDDISVVVCHASLKSGF
ncbi:Serine/threonine protein phosphatase [Ostreococcus tauri]|uniref:Protein phosphatase n=1 Tax=Ostreococcus tauri TaxID=70448 RepID=A0A1Y5IKU6_OSTTA|nr:Serine/threonine protein phosphatase [Ostreococcus tauri]